MRTLIFLTVLMVGIHSVMAQEAPELSVIGQSQISVEPTLTVISYTVRSKQMSYVAAVEDMTRRVDQLVDILKKTGFKTEEIVTSNFMVAEQFAYDRGQRRSDGFAATQALRIEFGVNKKRLLDILTKTTAGTVNAEVGISFTLDEAGKSALALQLIKMAVDDAKKKAEAIAEASGYTVTGIKEISYGSPPVTTPRPMARAETMTLAVSDAGGAQVSNFEAADLVFTDTVSIIYTIGPSK